jgi:predicted enzyme related to lactoylglutathione lyase
MKIALTSITVNNPKEAFRFYTEVLGFKEKMYMPEMNLAIVVSPEDENGTALLLEPNDNPIAKTFQEGVYKLGMPVIIFGVDDVQAEYERLSAKGVVFKQQPAATQWGTQAIFEDTCGNYVQIHHV